MVDFNTIILQFGEQGEKTGWTYIEIPQQIKPDNRQSVRVRGFLDEFAISGMAMMPFGNGNFMLALREQIRKGIHKGRGAMVRVRLEFDADFKIEIPDDLQECFEFEQPEALEFFSSLAKSHQGYFIKWINDAKTEQTRANRIANTINAALRRMDYGAMLREQKRLREK
jgi:hypothetical protein